MINTESKYKSQRSFGWAIIDPLGSSGAAEGLVGKKLLQLERVKVLRKQDGKIWVSTLEMDILTITMVQGGRSCATARPPVTASAGAPALAGSPSIRTFVAKSVLTRITRYWMHYFQLFSATSTVKMPVFMKNYKFCWQNCKKKRRLCCKNLQW